MHHLYIMVIKMQQMLTMGSVDAAKQIPIKKKVGILNVHLSGLRISKHFLSVERITVLDL